ncbi:MAG: epoxyqueuosine reductase, partial [Desulfobacterales bacterium]
MNKTTNSAAWIEQIIKDFIERSPHNTLQNRTNDKAFDTPLIGFSKGHDPLYKIYKEVVGPFHWTPLEIFTRTFKYQTVKPEDLTVISWILPQTQQTKADNRKQTTYPAERWARARIFGEAANVKLRKHVVAIL